MLLFFTSTKIFGKLYDLVKVAIGGIRLYFDREIKSFNIISSTEGKIISFDAKTFKLVKSIAWKMIQDKTATHSYLVEFT